MDSERPPQRLPIVSYILLGLLLVAMIAYNWKAWRGSGSARDADMSMRTVTPRGDLAADEQATVELFRKASPSVVYITTLTRRRDAFTLNVQQIPEGTGSGFIWGAAKQGGMYVVTNFHVIQNASVFQVTLADHSTWDARKVGQSPEKDLAVLWIDAPADRMHPIVVGTSSDLQVGQKVFAIGNPFGLDQSLTTGIISALGREIESLTGTNIPGAIQTDAAINPGNSGGPLLDSSARLIGVNTAIISPSRASAGIGFAIPVDEVNRVVTELIRHGRIIRPGLGISVAPDQTNIRLGGVLIIDVTEGGPAQKGGLRPTRRDEQGRINLGDIILAIEGKDVRTLNELQSTLATFEIGQTVTVTVRRGTEKMDVAVTLGAI